MAHSIYWTYSLNIFMRSKPCTYSAQQPLAFQTVTLAHVAHLFRFINYHVVYFLLPPTVVWFPSLRSPLCKHSAFPGDGLQGWRFSYNSYVYRHYCISEHCLHIWSKQWLMYINVKSTYKHLESRDEAKGKWFLVKKASVLEITVSVQEEYKECVGGGSPLLVPSSDDTACLSQKSMIL